MKMRSRQTVFNMVLKHLRKQGKRAMNRNESCRYRGPNGTKCAVGALIADEDYKPYWDRAVKAADNPVICEAARVDIKDAYFLGEVQRRLHDNLSDYDFLYDLEQQAEVFAEQYNLEYKCSKKQKNA